MVAGRSTEPRTATVTTTSSSAALTAAAGTFSKEDVGRSITGTGIPAATTVSAVASDTAATLSANATASGSITASIGVALYVNAGYSGWSPETAVESATYTVTANNAGTATPDKKTDTATRSQQRARG